MLPTVLYREMNQCFHLATNSTKEIRDLMPSISPTVHSVEIFFHLVSFCTEQTVLTVDTFD